MPIETNIKVRRGEDIVIEVAMVIPPVGGVASWTTRLTIRKKQDVTSDEIFSVDGVTIDAVNGIFTFTIPDNAQGTLVPPNTYFYDVWRTNSNLEAMLSYGEFLVKWAVRK